MKKIWQHFEIYNDMFLRKFVHFYLIFNDGTVSGSTGLDFWFNWGCILYLPTYYS